MPRNELSTIALREIVMRQPLITSRDVAIATGGSAAVVSVLMRQLALRGLVTKVMRGLWANTAHSLFSPYLVIGWLAKTWQEPVYVSFISALHLHGMLSQIPREIHVATAVQHPAMATPVGKFAFHRLSRNLLVGTEPGDRWNRFQRATAEKALFDTLYLGLRRKQQWRHLPEIELPENWSWSAWDPWLKRIAFEPFRVAMRHTRQQMEQNRKRFGSVAV